MLCALHRSFCTELLFAGCTCLEGQACVLYTVLLPCTVLDLDAPHCSEFSWAEPLIRLVVWRITQCPVFGAVLSLSRDDVALIPAQVRIRPQNNFLSQVRPTRPTSITSVGNRIRARPIMSWRCPRVLVKLACTLMPAVQLGRRGGRSRSSQEDI
jgi:hypothetical protein